MAGFSEPVTEDCPQSICHFCGREGHLARQCHFGQSLEIGPAVWQFVVVLGHTLGEESCGNKETNP